MASILKIGDKWRALVRRKGYKPISKTFKTKSQAVEWARQRETDMDNGQPVYTDPGVTVSQLIRKYRDLRDAARPISDKANEHYMLNRLDDAFGARKAATLTTSDIVDFCTERRKAGAGPYAVNMDISKLGTVYRYAGMAMNLQLPDPVGQARLLLKHLGLIGDGGKRERLPTEDEITRIIAELPQPHADVVKFAALTAMRRGEITRIRWSDVDAANHMVLVRDRKDPRQKQGNDQWVPLLNGAWELLQAQPRTEGEDRIFPLYEQTTSKYFKRVCDKLGIPDLHFHDLRHKAVTDLFNLGFQIQEVALVSGHRDWRHLRRYTNLKPEALRARGVALASRQHPPPAKPD